MTQTMVQLEQLDSRNPLECAAYERAFYRAFVGITSNRLIRTLWRWDLDAERLATRIPYADQTIYLTRDADRAIEMVMAVNTALRAFQSQAFGFALPDDPAGYCEMLAFFSVRRTPLTRMLRFREAVFTALNERGFQTAYGSTAARLLRFYRQFGATVLAQTEVEGEERYLLRYDLSRDWSVPERSDRLSTASAAKG